MENEKEVNKIEEIRCQDVYSNKESIVGGFEALQIRKES